MIHQYIIQFYLILCLSNGAKSILDGVFSPNTLMMMLVMLLINANDKGSPAIKKQPKNVTLSPFGDPPLSKRVKRGHIPHGRHCTVRSMLGARSNTILRILPVKGGERGTSQIRKSLFAGVL